ncbi:hypothetical protein SLA2020_292260 [Shorea laevis]
MCSKNFLGCLMITTVISLISSSQAYKFTLAEEMVGWLTLRRTTITGRGRNRFQVNDTLFFRYKKGSDSVLVVSKEDYFSCNIKNPIKSLTDGNSEFKFDRSGPFFFISGHVNNCNKGQKLIVVVLAVRHKHHYPPLPSPSPSPPAMSPAPVIDSPLSPPVSSPPSESPKAGDSDVPSMVDGPAAPAPSHKNWGSLTSELSTWLVVGLSVGVSVVLGSVSVV